MFIYYKSIINCRLVEIKRNWCYPVVYLNRKSEIEILIGALLNRFGTPQHQTNTMCLLVANVDTHVNTLVVLVHVVLVRCYGVPNLLRERQLRFRLISAKGQLICSIHTYIYINIHLYT